MTFNQWTKVAAGFTTTVIGAVAGLAGVGFMSEQDFKEKLQTFDKDKIEQTLSSHTENKDASDRLDHAMDGEILALFQCGPHIAAKVDGLQSADGHTILQDNGDHFIRWNTHDQKYERLEKILATIDPKTKTQFVATYNIEHKDLVMHWGGTDFFSPVDMMQATITASGGISPRALDGITYTNLAFDALEQTYSGLNPAEVNTSIVTHSVGAAAGSLSHLTATERGYAVNKIIHADPFGGQKAMETAAKAMGLSEELLGRHVTSVKPENPGLLDQFKDASRIMGQKETIAAKDHFGKSISVAYNNKIHGNRNN